MANEVWEKIKEFFITGWLEDKLFSSPVAGTALHEKSERTAEEFKATYNNASSMAKALLGGVGALGDFYFPADLIGGCCPRVVGEEQEIVWNAAAEAADTERVHIVWQAVGDKIWYLAVQSQEQGSHPDTWCPFASLLPGLRDAAKPPIIYTYFSDEMATMMTVLSDSLHIHRGTTSVVRAKAERVSRENNEAPIVDLVPDRIAKLTPFPWYSLSLYEERARRILASVSIAASLLLTFVGILIWLFSAMIIVSAHADMDVIKERSATTSVNLLKMVQAQRASPMREQLADFADVNDGLLSLNGFLEVYIIKRNQPVWRAIVPRNVTAERIKEIGGQTLDSSDPRGVLIGNNRDALEIDQTGKERKKR
ncbi:MAG: hypothetical protein AB7S81_05570 [Bdellovibrionales bacterium]